MLAALSLVVFCAVSLRHLDVVPPVYEDEPWQASVGYKLATQGVFGSDLFAGFYHMEQHYYAFMPLHPLLLAVDFRLFGVGLQQARLEAVVMGLATLVLTFSLGSRLFGLWVGSLALFLLVFVRWTGLTYEQLSGIPLLDLSRIARYDVLVPVLGLSALHLYVSARRGQALALYGAAGALAGLAGLAHLYGAFWLPALLVLTIWDRGRRGLGRPLACLLVGFVLVWLPYLAYVASGLPDFLGQTRSYVQEGRFGLLDPAWYARNLLGEPRRYGPGLGPFGLAWLVRVGFWSAAAGLPLSLVALALRAVRQRDVAARALLVPLVVIGTLFGLLISLKLVNYTLTLLPLAALSAGWGFAAAWRRLQTQAAGRLGRLALVGLLVLIGAEGAWRIGTLEAAAASATPYPQLIDRVRQHIPRGGRILALHRYWFGLEDHDVRSFAVPLRLTEGALLTDPLSLDAALDRVDPEIVLIDDRMRAVVGEPPPAASRDEQAAQFWSWMGRRQARLLDRIVDPTYGTFDVYRVDTRALVSTASRGS
jgi:4-amino-4-deoxy-L-arabinose transferase-like glycosyltransferase